MCSIDTHIVCEEELNIFWTFTQIDSSRHFDFAQVCVCVIFYCAPLYTCSIHVSSTHPDNRHLTTRVGCGTPVTVTQTVCSINSSSRLLALQLTEGLCSCFCDFNTCNTLILQPSLCWQLCWNGLSTEGQLTGFCLHDLKEITVSVISYCSSWALQPPTEL